MVTTFYPPYSTGGDVSRFQRSSMPSMNARSQRTPAAVGVSATVNGGRVYTGPTVRVTRGKATSEVPVRAGAGALLDQQAAGMRSGARTVPVAGAVLVR